MDTQLDVLHHTDRPEGKIKRLSPEALSDKELLAVILGCGAPKDGVLEKAGRILAAHPGGFRTLTYDAMRRMPGIGPKRAAVLAAAYELVRRDSGKDYRPVLDNPSRVMEQIPAEVRNGKKEHFVALYLNARSQLVHYETVSIGTLSASLVHPREVYAPAIAKSAAALVVVHNHPSGDCSPSAEDRDATRRLSRSGELLGIPLLDHVIVAEGAHYSFKEHGLLS